MMRTLMTINGTVTLSPRDKRALQRVLVIIAMDILSVCGARAAESPGLTTAAVPVLTTVVIDGSTAYAPPQLFAAYRDQLGLPITGENARAVSAALAALYEHDGYVKPEVALDNSLTGRGVLRVRVYEAQISNVTFEGDSGHYRDALEDIAANLQSARPLRKDDLPQALRAMRQFAGLAVTATTRRDTSVRNAYELVVQTDFSAVEGMVRMNNRGTDQIGPNFLLGQLFANGLFGRGEKVGLIFASATDPEEYLGGGLFVDVGLGDAATRANALLFRSHSAPNEAPVNLDDQYTRQRASLRVSRPLRQESAFSLALSAAFDADDLFIDRDGVSIREDRLRIIETALRGSWRGSSATQYSANLALRKGLNGFGSGLEAPDLIDDPRRADFLLTQLQASIYRRFATEWSVRFDAFSQLSSYVLPDGERFKIGGDRLGRGFEVAEIAGDSGLGGKIELRRDLLNTDTLVGRLSVYGFYDIGAAWKQDQPGRESAATAGTGLAIQGATLTGYLEIAAPLTGPDIEGKLDPSVFAELSYRF
jgi:hemolysin activation/secretion protein